MGRDGAHDSPDVVGTGISSLELRAQLTEAARDPARDRPGREIEGLADRPVALVAGEKAVEDLAAAAGKGAQSVVHVESLVEPLERRVELLALRKLGRLLAGA